MKLIIVAVRDIKTDMFGPPMVVNHEQAAIRSFADQIANGGDAVLKSHPEDFELYKLGTYNDNTGEFENDKEQLAVGSSYRIKQ